MFKNFIQNQKKLKVYIDVLLDRYINIYKFIYSLLFKNIRLNFI